MEKEQNQNTENKISEDTDNKENISDNPDISSDNKNEVDEKNYEMQLSTNISGWHHVCFTLSGGIVRGYINGEERKCFGTGQNSYGDARFSGNVFSQATHKSPLRIGQGVVNNYAPFTGSLSLLRMSNQAVSQEQLKTIVNDESRLFQENAKCTLYGTSDRIRGLVENYQSKTAVLLL